MATIGTRVSRVLDGVGGGTNDPRTPRPIEEKEEKEAKIIVVKYGDFQAPQNIDASPGQRQTQKVVIDGTLCRHSIMKILWSIDTLVGHKKKCSSFHYLPLWSVFLSRMSFTVISSSTSCIPRIICDLVQNPSDHPSPIIAVQIPPLLQAPIQMLKLID